MQSGASLRLFEKRRDDTFRGLAQPIAGFDNSLGLTIWTCDVLDNRSSLLTYQLSRHSNTIEKMRNRLCPELTETTLSIVVSQLSAAR